MPNPRAAMLVIGDEILSGRTRDSNMHHLAGKLAAHGIDLIEARVVGDVHATIAATVAELAGRVDHVFTSGGIGPTHDDITADAVAEAMGAAIDVRADARAVLEAHYAARDTELNAARLRMARIPEGAVLIDNPVSAAPGFTLGNVHVMAGVPSIFEAMLAGLLPTLAGGAALGSRSLRVERGEGDIAAALSEIAAAHPEVGVGSYPSSGAVTVLLRSADGAALEAAMDKLRAAFPEGTE